MECWFINPFGLWVEGQYRTDVPNVQLRKSSRAGVQLKKKNLRESAETELSITPRIARRLQRGLWGRTRANGKSEVKCAALSEFRFDPDSARMLFDHHFGNVEAKSYAATILAIDL